jgi:tetratricopeptide (TPR) repeat protein
MECSRFIGERFLEPVCEVSSPHSDVDIEGKSLDEPRIVKRFATVLLISLFFVIQTGHLCLSAEESPENLLKQEVSDAFQSHDYKKVIRLYRQFSATKPDRYLPASVKILYSQALADTGDLDGAIDAMKDVLADSRPETDPVQLQYDLANLLFLQKRFDEARTAYQKLLLQTGRNADLLSKAKERLALMKDKDANAKRKDIESLQLIDLETALEAGDIPDGAEEALARIIRRDPKSEQAAEARILQERIRGVRTQRAKGLLDEARRLFDEEKKYVEVRSLLEEIQRRYSDVCETASVEALRKAVDAKTGKAAR